jgi:hypothetical protein
MFWVFLALAFVTIGIAWVLGEALATFGRWPHNHRNSEFPRDFEIDPAKHRNEMDFGTPSLVFAMFLLFCLVPSAVTSNGQSISLHEISDSVQASMDAGSVNMFVKAWRAEYPLQFLIFFVGLPVTVIWLFRRSPVVLGMAVCAGLFVFWLKTIAGVSILGF